VIRERARLALELLLSRSAPRLRGRRALSLELATTALIVRGTRRPAREAKKMASDRKLPTNHSGAPLAITDDPVKYQMRRSGVLLETIDGLKHPRHIKTDEPKAVFDSPIRPARRN
jgi:hypothetical protein